MRNLLIVVLLALVACEGRDPTPRVDGAQVDPSSWPQQMEAVTAMVETVEEAYREGNRERAVAACDHAYHDLFRAQFAPTARSMVDPADLLKTEYAFGQLRYAAARPKAKRVEASAARVRITLERLAESMQLATAPSERHDR